MLVRASHQCVGIYAFQNHHFGCFFGMKFFKKSFNARLNFAIFKKTHTLRVSVCKCVCVFICSHAYVRQCVCAFVHSKSKSFLNSKLSHSLFTKCNITSDELKSRFMHISTEQHFVILHSCLGVNQHYINKSYIQFQLSNDNHLGVGWHKFINGLLNFGVCDQFKLNVYFFFKEYEHMRPYVGLQVCS